MLLQFIGVTLSLTSSASINDTFSHPYQQAEGQRHSFWIEKLLEEGNISILVNSKTHKLKKKKKKKERKNKILKSTYIYIHILKIFFLLFSLSRATIIECLDSRCFVVANNNKLITWRIDCLDKRNTLTLTSYRLTWKTWGKILKHLQGCKNNVHKSYTHKEKCLQERKITRTLFWALF